MTVQRRGFLRLAAATAALPALSRLASAESYPSRPVRIIVGTAAGGGTDIVARVVAQWLTENLGQSFVVENRPGGANNIATEAVAHGPADGYTLFMANSVNTINASIFTKLNYNFIADFAPVVHCMTSPMLLMVHPAFAAKSVPELIAMAKASPGTINMASGGNGASGHMAGELFKMMAGVNLVHVPYRGEAPAMTDLIGGQAQVAFAASGSSLQSAKAGLVRPLAVTTAAPIAALPDVPPLGQFLPGYEASSWSGLVAPKDTPAEIVDKLAKDVSAALADAKVRQRIADTGSTVPGTTRAEFAKFIVDETEKWSKVAKFAGVKIN